jgi:hypothetical protein
MEKWLYFHVFDDDAEVLVCCAKEKIFTKEDLVQLDAFLSYYGQNYKLHRSDFEDTTHTCFDMKCIRKHVIDVNIKK